LTPWVDADFSFDVYVDMKKHTVYVKKRPHLQHFLEKVAQMFEIVIFTASQSSYASKLLDQLDPDGHLFSRRVYRDSCIFFSEGDYTKDLTILGVDLAKVAIIDNLPQVKQVSFIFCTFVISYSVRYGRSLILYLWCF
jgi:CTD small phosphatase-like protein 2